MKPSNQARLSASLALLGGIGVVVAAPYLAGLFEAGISNAAKASVDCESAEVGKTIKKRFDEVSKQAIAAQNQINDLMRKSGGNSPAGMPWPVADNIGTFESTFVNPHAPAYDPNIKRYTCQGTMNTIFANETLVRSRVITYAVQSTQNGTLITSGADQPVMGQQVDDAKTRRAD